MIFAFTSHPLVHVNASLNALATLLLIVGYVLVKRGNHKAHGRVMLATFAVSCLFLVCYLVYHYLVGSVKFTYPGFVRYIYLTILLTHVVLAAAVPVLAIVTINYGLKGNGILKPDNSADVRSEYLRKHRRWARWTFPIWMYVSVTGVVVYLMLYHLWPPTQA